MTKHFEGETPELAKEEKQVLIPEVVLDTEEILESVSLKMDEVEPEIEIAKPIAKKQKNGKDEDKVAKELYDEFSSFLQDKEDMTPEVELKRTIPTGIDVLDAILGGGFAIGALSIIVGQPGSGKSMLAMQAMGNAQKINIG